jgi:hypothetical protein
VPAQQLQVIAAGSTRLTLLTQHLVLQRCGRVGQVGQRGDGGRAALLHPTQLVSQVLLALRSAPDLRDRPRSVLARALQRADALGRLILGLPQLLELGQYRAPALVKLEGLIEE